MRKYVWFGLVLLLSINVVLNGADKKKILYVDSYHKGYPWSDGITEGICTTLGAKLYKNDRVDNSSSKVELKIHRMDTKLFSTLNIKDGATDAEKKAAQEEFKRNAALNVKELIEQRQPDVVIASDDNASKYLIAPYYKNAE